VEVRLDHAIHGQGVCVNVDRLGSNTLSGSADPHNRTGRRGRRRPSRNHVIGADAFEEIRP
jgi:hypothetical protein